MLQRNSKDTSPEKDTAPQNRQPDLISTLPVQPWSVPGRLSVPQMALLSCLESSCKLHPP